MGSERWGRRAGRQRRGGQRATGDWRGRGEKGSERESAEGEGVDTRARARARDALKGRNIIPQRGLPHLASLFSRVKASRRDQLRNQMFLLIRTKGRAPNIRRVGEESSTQVKY